MKAKKLFTLILAVLIAAMTIVSVSAAQLTDQNPGGQTEVIAHISGNPGDVHYIITIPDVVDFGELVRPDNDDDSFKKVGYTVSLDEVEGLDPDTQQINVYVRDEKSDIDHNQEFWIANKTDSSKQFSYDVFRQAPQDVDDELTESVNQNTMTTPVGYYLTGFTIVGETLEGTLRINQKQLRSYNLSDIIGDYSGYMVFYSAIEDK